MHDCPPTPSGAALDALRETDIKARRDAVMQLTFKLAADGDKAFRMSIPLRQDDSDVLLLALCDDVTALLDHVAALSTRLAVAGEEIAALQQQVQGWTKNGQPQGQEQAARDAAGAPAYDADVGKVLNEYLVASNRQGTDYSRARHTVASHALDALLGALCRDRVIVDYLSDWFSGGNEIVIASTQEPGVRVDVEQSDAGRRDRLWVYEPGSEEPGETVRDAVLDAMRNDASRGDPALAVDPSRSTPEAVTAARRSPTTRGET